MDHSPHFEQTLRDTPFPRFVCAQTADFLAYNMLTTGFPQPHKVGPALDSKPNRQPSKPSSKVVTIPSQVSSSRSRAVVTQKGPDSEKHWPLLAS